MQRYLGEENSVGLASIMLTGLPRNMPIEQVATSVGPGIFMQGPGGLAAVLFCERYGRYVNLPAITPLPPSPSSCQSPQIEPL